jgi:hypothetical protein
MAVQTPPAICLYNPSFDFALSFRHTLQSAVRKNAVSIPANTIPATCLYRLFSCHVAISLVLYFLAKACLGVEEEKPGKVANFGPFEKIVIKEP